MSTSGARPRLLVPTLIAVTAALVATALGAWQLQRKAWKEGLIAAMDARLAAALVPLPPASEWPSLTAADAEFRRVKFHAQFEQRPGVWVYVAGSALRDDIKDPGYFAFQPARLDDGRTVVVNRGYVPMDRTVPWAGGSLDVVGYLRWPEARPWFLSDTKTSSDTWFLPRWPPPKAGAMWRRFMSTRRAPCRPAACPAQGRLRSTCPMIISSTP